MVVRNKKVGMLGMYVCWTKGGPHSPATICSYGWMFYSATQLISVHYLTLFSAGQGRLGRDFI